MKTVVLTGGVGGAKLVQGLASIVSPSELTVVVNTGDDFRHLGLSISPDIDTLLYTLSGRADRERGWGRKDESWNFMEALREVGAEDWFQLGDRDLAVHVLRTHRLEQGGSLTAVTAELAQAFGISAAILPMSDQPVETMIDTDVGLLSFQRYFVAMRCGPRAHAITFEGAALARPAPGVLSAIAEASIVLIAPSNPFLSIDPILAVPGISEAICASSAIRVAVSPLVSGASVKGPTAKLMGEMGIPVSNQAIATHYGALIDGLLLHEGDDVPTGVAVGACDTLMRSDDDKKRVASAALALARQRSARRDA